MGKNKENFMTYLRLSALIKQGRKYWKNFTPEDNVGLLIQDFDTKSHKRNSPVYLVAISVQVSVGDLVGQFPFHKVIGPVVVRLDDVQVTVDPLNQSRLFVVGDVETFSGPVGGDVNRETVCVVSGRQNSFGSSIENDLRQVIAEELQSQQIFAVYLEK